MFFLLFLGKHMGDPGDIQRFDARGTPSAALVPAQGGPDLLEHRQL